MKIEKNHAPVILAAAGSIIYLSLIFNNNLWMDEAFTAVLVRGSFMSMLRASMADTLPPLYNIILWAMTHLLGYRAPIMKLTSVLPMIMLLFLGCTAVKRNFGLRSSVIFILCMISAPELFHYGVEIRMYSLGLLFSTASAVYAYECAHSAAKRCWVMLVCTTVLAGYTHQFAIIASFFIWVMLLIYALLKSHGLIKTLLLSGICTVFLYIPCLIVTYFQLKQASGYFSAVSPSFSAFFSSVRFPFVTNFSPLSASLLALFIFVSIFGARKCVGFAYSYLYIVILLFAYAVMLSSGSPFFSSRYLVPSFGILWLGFAINSGGEWHISPKISRKVILFVLASVLTMSGAVCYRNQFCKEYLTGVDKMTAYFKENLSSEDGYLIYEDNYQIELCMRYYEPGLKKYGWNTISDISGNIWYFEVPGFEKELDSAASYGYNKEYIGDMSFDIYSFKLYRLHRLHSDVKNNNG